MLVVALVTIFGAAVQPGYTRQICPAESQADVRDIPVPNCGIMNKVL
jgi:hypothetical protein